MNVQDMLEECRKSEVLRGNIQRILSLPEGFLGEFIQMYAGMSEAECRQFTTRFHELHVMKQPYKNNRYGGTEIDLQQLPAYMQEMFKNYARRMNPIALDKNPHIDADVQFYGVYNADTITAEYKTEEQKSISVQGRKKLGFDPTLRFYVECDVATTLMPSVCQDISIAYYTALNNIGWAGNYWHIDPSSGIREVLLESKDEGQLVEYLEFLRKIGTIHEKAMSTIPKSIVTELTSKYSIGDGIEDSVVDRIRITYDEFDLVYYEDMEGICFMSSPKGQPFIITRKDSDTWVRVSKSHEVYKRMQLMNRIS